MNSPNQAHGGNSRPPKVTLDSSFKTNVPMTTCVCTPKQSAKKKPEIYQTRAALNGNGVN